MYNTYIVKPEDENLPGLLLFKDFEKAFDSINHEFMFNCLKCFNLSSDIINWIKCFLIMMPKVQSLIQDI